MPITPAIPPITDVGKGKLFAANANVDVDEQEEWPRSDMKNWSCLNKNIIFGSINNKTQNVGVVDTTFYLPTLCIILYLFIAERN